MNAISMQQSNALSKAQNTFPVKHHTRSRTRIEEVRVEVQELPEIKAVITEEESEIVLNYLNKTNLKLQKEIIGLKSQIGTINKTFPEKKVPYQWMSFKQIKEALKSVGLSGLKLLSDQEDTPVPVDTALNPMSILSAPDVFHPESVGSNMTMSMNFWNNAQLNSVFPKVQGFGKKAPIPSYRTNSAMVLQWRNYTQEQQNALVTSYASLDKEERRKIESKVTGSKTPCTKKTNLKEILETECKRLGDALAKKSEHIEKLKKKFTQYEGLDHSRNRSNGITNEEKNLTLDYLKELHIPKIQKDYEKLSKEAQDIKSNATPENIVPYITMNAKDLKAALRSLGISYQGITSRHDLAFLLDKSKYHGGKSERAQLAWYGNEIKRVNGDSKKTKKRIGVLDQAKTVS